ncbi:MAG: TonB-dependent receptor plug domain-containing protein [Alistipes sp.]|nr:TonB-dependent receptor plug domain-containing protein [Alistipes sp.]
MKAVVVKAMVACAAIMLSAVAVMAQSGRDGSDAEPFNGLIVDADGRGLKARVEVVGSDRFTVADSKGRFGLTNISADDSLRISYKRKVFTVAVASRRSLHIIWKYDDVSRNRVTEDQAIADMGLQYVKRRDRVTPSAGISGDRLRATGMTNVVDALMLCVPGLAYENGELCIRGSRSVNSKSGVLILCDGAEVQRLDNINLDDVESVEVVRGANSYGFRGTNGVIMVTTKSGRRN